jgi:hypothetical protein
MSKIERKPESEPNAETGGPVCLKAALDYARRGFSVVLLHGVVDGHCTCRKQGCGSPGKHPIDSWMGAQTKRATPEQLEKAFSHHPHANVGIVTGAISGLLVVDLDGPAGMSSCMKVMAGKEPPQVPTVRTGGGYHLYGLHPGTPLKNFVKKHPGLDGRTDGGYVVAPPSHHASGRVYEWTRPLEDALPELPSQLLALFSTAGDSPKQSSNTSKKHTLPADTEDEPSVTQHQRRVPDHVKKYVDKALADECAIIATAVVGTQENALCTAALKIGNYVGARLLDFEATRNALVAAGLHMVNDPEQSPWTRAELLKKVEAKLRIGMNSPKWGPDPRGEEDDRSPPLDVFGDTGLAGSPTFPTDALHLGLSEFVADRAERTGVAPEMIAMPALAACAAALDDHHVVQVRRHDKQWVESARLWVAIVEQPGGKKTPAINAAMGPLHDIEIAWQNEDRPKFDNYERQQHLYEQQLKSRDQLNRALVQAGLVTKPQKPPQRRLIVSDVTTEKLAHILADNPAGVIAIFDELAQLLGSFDAYRGGKGALGRDRALWLELYNGGRRSVDRVTTGHLDIPNWGASMVGGIQPERLRGLITNLSEDGMLQRCISVFGSGPSMGVDRAPDEKADQTYRRVLETIAGWRGKEPVRVRLSEEAHEVRERVMKHVQALLMLPETPGPLKKSSQQVGGTVCPNPAHDARDLLGVPRIRDVR